MTYTDSDLTQWFNLSEQKPWEPGVYAVTMGTDCGKEWSSQFGEWFAWFDGHKFMRASRSLIAAYDQRDKLELDCACVMKWSGLNYDPSLPKRLARRTDPATSHAAAKQAVKSGARQTHMDKIHGCLKANGAMTPNQIAAKLKMRRSSVFRLMSDLRMEGKASRTGEKRGGQSVWNAI